MRLTFSLGRRLPSYGGLRAAALILLLAVGLPSARAESAPVRVPLLSFVFDDGYDTDRTLGLEIFREEGAVASSAIITDCIGLPDYMNADQIRELEAAGWEIMSHTVSHPNLRSLNEQQLDTELLSSREVLEGIGVRVRNVVYPYNKSNALVERIASRYYRSGRGGGSAFNFAETSPFRLRSFEIKDDLAKLEKLVDEAGARGEWLILYHHRIMEKLYIADGGGHFRTDETVDCSPSGAVGRFEPTIWNRVGHSLYVVPVSGAALPGDLVVGEERGAKAQVEDIGCDERELIRSLLRYAKGEHPEMRIVTIDQGLDALGVSGGFH
jgi:peptidoglycan/xylan/chitin deacetylase (PgdA/CDA1 family)